MNGLLPCFRRGKEALGSATRRRSSSIFRSANGTKSHGREGFWPAQWMPTQAHLTRFPRSIVSVFGGQTHAAILMDRCALVALDHRRRRCRSRRPSRSASSAPSAGRSPPSATTCAVLRPRSTTTAGEIGGLRSRSLRGDQIKAKVGCGSQKLIGSGKVDFLVGYIVERDARLARRSSTPRPSPSSAITAPRSSPTRCWPYVFSTFVEQRQRAATSLHEPERASTPT